ncbi:hypothetical protein C2G38_2027339 [Gigaspora rosea]|uniref:Uncharacterized protein n=1 Tax=Gigaspora rosea TaxID=44941 RepID=A0A397W912_9GLOM|nr:hypothetical protein C2G38_2027339 [Gigaspora rosea]
MPCPGRYYVSDLAWYSPYFTKVEEFGFCKECYNQYIRNTPLNIHIQSVGIVHKACACAFTHNVKQQWFLAVGKNDINLFKKYVEKVLERNRDIRDRIARLQILTTQEMQRKQSLISLQFLCYSRGTIRFDESVSPYQHTFNDISYPSSGYAEAVQIKKQINESSKTFNNYIAEMRKLELEHFLGIYLENE